MIILVSRDFKPLAQALENLYDESHVELLDPADWIFDLSTYDPGKHISRLTIIGHSDSYYGEEQAFFGGNPSERVMLIEEFAHALMNLLKHNERLHPGFCKHLKHIDLIDCHVGEKKFIAEHLAKYIQKDAILGEFGAHFIISSFTNTRRPTNGTVLMPNEENNEVLSFYTFKSIDAFNEYKETHFKLAELRAELHHLEQIPGHTAILSNGKNKADAIAQLEKKCETLEKKEQKILKNHTHKSLHITDPRHYLDKHRACRIVIADLPKPTQTRKEHTMTKHAKHSIKRKPHFFATKTEYSHSSATHTTVLEGHMFHHKPKHSIEGDNTPHPLQRHKK